VKNLILTFSRRIEVMGYTCFTRHHHNMYDMASMMQKAIRRCDVQLASYAAYELYGNYSAYMWRRLLVISAEDCYGIITKEIIALKLADDTVNKNRKGYDKDAIFVAKAVYLLCIARKSRDACFVACEFMIPDKCLNEDEIPNVTQEELDAMEIKDKDIPDWVFDVHTIKGKSMGKTDVQMTVEEQDALNPKTQMSLFDDCGWQESFEDDFRAGRLNKAEKYWYDRLLKNRPRGSDVAKKLIMTDDEVAEADKLSLDS
jgi:replication-associated recombination protein RarA